MEQLLEECVNQWLIHSRCVVMQASQGTQVALTQAQDRFACSTSRSDRRERPLSGLCTGRLTHAAEPAEPAGVPGQPDHRYNAGPRPRDPDASVPPLSVGSRALAGSKSEPQRRSVRSWRLTSSRPFSRLQGLRPSSPACRRVTACCPCRFWLPWVLSRPSALLVLSAAWRPSPPRQP